MSDKEKFTTTEICTPLSHGIWDHIFKFSPMPLSFPIYCHMLCFAKKQGPDQGLYRFSVREMVRLFTFGNEPRGDRRQESVSRSTILRAVVHLEDIGFIKIIHRPKDRKDSCWEVRVNKYKGGLDSFMTVLQVNKSDDGEVVGFQPMTEQQVMAFDKEHANDVVTNTETNPESRSHRDMHNFDKWLPNLSLNIIANIMKLVSSSDNEIYRWNQKVMANLEDSTKDAAQVLARDFRELRYNLASSHVILAPDLAVKLTTHLTSVINDKDTKTAIKRAYKEARYEIVRHYWNNMRWGNKNEFAFHRTTTPPNEKRMDKTAKRFEDKFFQENWAYAVCKMRQSAYCRGEKTSWRASLHEGSFAFLESDEAVRRGLDGGRYVEDDGSERRSGLARSFTVEEYAGKGSSVFDEKGPEDDEDSSQRSSSDAGGAAMRTSSGRNE